MPHSHHLQRGYGRVQRGTRELFHGEVLPALPYWVAGALTGLIASGYAVLFRFFTERSLLLFHRHFVLWAFLVPIGFLASHEFVSRYAPRASGSGIPQVMAAIEEIETADPRWLKSLLSLRVVLVKVLSSVVMIASGGAIGREGPTIQIGSSLFLGIEDYFVRKQWVSRKDPVASRKAFILAGGAAGIAAAFNTPLGGIVFAIEELATESFKQFRTTVITGVIVAGVTAQGFLGSYLYLGQPSLAKITGASIALGTCMGVLGGVAGGVFGKTLYLLTRVKKRWFSGAKRFGIILLLAAAFVLLAWSSAGYGIGSGAEGIADLLFKDAEPSMFKTIVRYLASQISYVVGGAGGIFAPSLAVGGNLGAYVATLFPHSGIDSHLMILIGMAAFLTGVTHAPFTSLVLVIEMSDKSAAIFPLMLSTMAGLYVARWIDPHSFYERMRADFLPQDSRVPES